MKVYIGADHRGFQLKNDIIEHLRRAGHEVADEGDKNYNPDDDFPQYATQVANAVLAEGKDGRGILICGSGQGMCMAANRFRGIRACLGHNVASVRSSRNDDDSNVLCLAADEVKSSKAYELVDIWLGTEFSGAGRFVRRIKELDEL